MSPLNDPDRNRIEDGIEDRNRIEDGIEDRTNRQNGSADRDVKLAYLENERKSSLIKAWEESKISKAVNKAEKKICDVRIWENRKSGAIDERIAKFIEKMDNQKTEIQKEAEVRRAVIKCTKEREILQAQEMSAKYRAEGLVPKSTRKFFF